MTWAQEVAAGQNSIYSIAGVAATFTDRDGAETSLTVVVEHDLSEYGATLEVSGSYAIISARKSELQYAPRRGETYAIAGTTYTVDSILREDEIEHTVLAT